MKPLLKLGFTDTFEGAKKFFPEVFAERYEVVIDNDNPNYLIFGDKNFGFNNQQFNPQTTIKIFFTGENERPWDYQCHYSMCFDHIENENVIRFPHYVIYEYDHKIRDRQPRHRLDTLECRKKKFCSFLQKNPHAEKRNWYFHELSKYKQVDSWGPLFNNTGNKFPDGSGEKVDCMSNYKFNLCFENASYPGYCTERLYEALCAKTVPIYWGSGTAAMDFNPKAFLNWHDFRNDKAFIEAIIELDNNQIEYMKMYNQPMFADGSRFSKYFYNDYILDWFDRNVYKGAW